MGQSKNTITTERMLRF